MSGVEFITDLRTDIAKRAYDEVMFAASPREAKKIQESQSAILDTGIRGYDSRKGPRYDSIVRNVEQYNADQAYQPHIFAAETDKEVFGRIHSIAQGIGFMVLDKADECAHPHFFRGRLQNLKVDGLFADRVPAGYRWNSSTLFDYIVNTWPEQYANDFMQLSVTEVTT